MALTVTTVSAIGVGTTSGAAGLTLISYAMASGASYNLIARVIARDSSTGESVAWEIPVIGAYRVGGGAAVMSEWQGATPTAFPQTKIPPPEIQNAEVWAAPS